MTNITSTHQSRTLFPTSPKYEQPPQSGVTEINNEKDTFQKLSEQYDLRNMTGSNIISLYDSLVGAGALDGQQRLAMVVMAGVDPQQHGPDQTPRDLLQNSQDYLSWASVNEPKTATALEGLINIFQSITRLQNGDDSKAHWVA